MPCRDREKRNAYMRKYRQDNAEHLREYDKYRNTLRANQMKRYREEHKTQATERSKEYSNNVRQYVVDYKNNHSCIRCGNNDSRVLVFHHRNPAEKSFDLGAAKRFKVSTQTLQAEIDKCDLLCANCHMIVHWEVKEGQHE